MNLIIIIIVYYQQSKKIKIDLINFDQIFFD